MLKGDTIKQFGAGRRTVYHVGLDVCVFFFLALFPGLLSVAPRPLMILSEHPGPDVVFYQEDGALGSPKGSCAEEEGSLIEGGLHVRHESDPQFLPAREQNSSHL